MDKKNQTDQSKNTSETSLDLTPAEAVAKLLDGNARFVSGVRSVDSMLTQLRMADLAKDGQKPFAVVLTCSDSRSPAEMIFDQGLGDLFVVRVAGNVIAPTLLASIEFAVANFGCPAIMVLGHTLCGAVTATIQHTENPTEPLPSPHLEELVGRIRPAVEAVNRKNSKNDSDYFRKATIENVYRSMRIIIDQSKIVRTLVESGKVSVNGAVLDIATGVVNVGP